MSLHNQVLSHLRKGHCRCGKEVAQPDPSKRVVCEDCKELLAKQFEQAVSARTRGAVLRNRRAAG